MRDSTIIILSNGVFLQSLNSLDLKFNLSYYNLVQLTWEKAGGGNYILQYSSVQ